MDETQTPALFKLASLTAICKVPSGFFRLMFPNGDRHFRRRDSDLPAPFFPCPQKYFEKISRRRLKKFFLRLYLGLADHFGGVPDSTGPGWDRLHAEDDRWPR